MFFNHRSISIDNLLFSFTQKLDGSAGDRDMRARFARINCISQKID